jgi:hypothetical protein
LIIPMAGYRSATAASSSPTTPSIRSDRSPGGNYREQAPRLRARLYPQAAAAPRAATAQHQSAAPTRSAQHSPVQGRLSCSTSRAGRRPLGKKAVRFRRSVLRAPVGRCATPGAPRPPTARPKVVTFLNGRNGDISIWWTPLRTAGVLGRIADFVSSGTRGIGDGGATGFFDGEERLKALSGAGRSTGTTGAGGGF